MRIQIAALASLLCVSAARAAEKRVCAGFLPENTLNIPIGPVHADGVAEDRFNRVLDRVEKVYKGAFKKRGKELVVRRNWDDGTVNAYAQQDGDKWIISMYGGLARHPAVTEDGFAVVACHEIGHHIGGYPNKGYWATNEGGSDYFATLKCLRQVLPQSWPFTVDEGVAKACRDARGVFSAKDCERAAMAGLSVSNLLAELGGEGALSFATPDPTVVDEMMDWHPPAQCRLDTYFQGALCAKRVGAELSSTDPNKGACTARNKDRVGLRPRCWYKPPADEPSPIKPRQLLASEEEAGGRARLAAESLAESLSTN